MAKFEFFESEKKKKKEKRGERAKESEALAFATQTQRKRKGGAGTSKMSVNSTKIQRIISAEVSEVLARRNSFLSEYAIFHFKRKNGGSFSWVVCLYL